jgi:hypothetical protein
MKLTYSINRSDWLDFYIAVTPLRPANPLLYYSWLFLIAGLLFAFAYFAIVSMGVVPLGILSAWTGACVLWSSIPYSRQGRKALEAKAARQKPHDVILELTDEGLTETAFGICSIAPWSSALHVKKHEGIVLVALTSGHYGIIPRSVVTSLGMSEDELIRFIDERIQKAKP